MRRAPIFIGLASTVALSACVVAPPPGPSVMATPGQGKDFAAFQQDDGFCRQVGDAADRRYVADGGGEQQRGRQRGASARPWVPRRAPRLGRGRRRPAWAPERRSARAPDCWPAARRRRRCAGVGCRGAAALRYGVRAVHGVQGRQRAAPARRLCRWLRAGLCPRSRLCLRLRLSFAVLFLTDLPGTGPAWRSASAAAGVGATGAGVGAAGAGAGMGGGWGGGWHR